MVVGQFFLLKGVSAILTDAFVPDIEVLSRKFDDGRPSFNQSLQTDHGGQLEGDADAFHPSLVDFNHLDLSDHDHHDGLLPGDHSQRFVG